MLWNDENVEVLIRYVHKFFIHAVVSSRGGKHWKLTIVYASPIMSRRRILWQRLSEM